MTTPHDGATADRCDQVDGVNVRPAFQVFKEQMASYTPEWAGEVCGLPSGAIRKVAEDLGANARIGSTIVIARTNKYLLFISHTSFK